MKKHHICAVITSFVVLLTSALAVAQGTGPTGLQRVAHDTSMTGYGTTSSVLRIRTDCSSTELLTWDGDSWECTPLPTGDITAVTVTTGLSGGGTSGAVTVNLAMSGAACSLGSVMTALGATGVGTCTAIGAAGGITGTGTLNKITKWLSSTSHGDSSASDDGTTFAINTTKFTVTESNGNTTVAGTLDAGGAVTDTGNRVFSIAGNGLTSTGTTVDVAVGTGLSVAANAVNLNMTGAACSAGSVMTALGATGVGTCTAIGTAGGVTGSTLTTNIVPKATSATAIGNSLIKDDSTTFSYNTNKLTVDSTTGNTAVAGTLDAVGALTENGTRVFGIAGAGLTSTGRTVDVGAGTNITVNANDVALATNVAIGGTFSVIAGATTLSAINGTTINPTGLTGTLTDWAPAGLATATIIKMSTAANTTLTGIDAPTDGRKITLYNAGPNIVTLTHNATSTVGKRFFIPEAGNWAIRSGSSVDVHYELSAGFWILEGNTRYPTLTADSSLSSPINNALGTTTVTTLTGLDGLTANLAVTAQTASTSPIVANNTGTYNATAAVRSSYAGKFTNSATRSTGANNVTDYGVWSSASGGQVNYGLWVDAGDAVINTGAFTVSAGLSTLSGGTTATGTVNLGTATTGTTTTKGPAVLQQTLGVTGDVAVNTNKLTVTASTGLLTTLGGVSSEGTIQTTASGNILADGNLTSNNNLDVGGVTTLSGGTTALGAVNLGTATTGTTTTKGPAVLDQTLGVTGLATLNGGTTASGTISLGTATTGTTTHLGPGVFQQTLGVTGVSTLSGGTTASGAVNLGTVTTGTTTTKGPAVFDQTIGVTGVATLGGGTDANNTVNLGKATTGTTTIRGPAVLDQTLTAKGNITRGTSTTVFHLTDLDTSLRPTLGSGGANCGTAATLKGNDASGVITVGTGGASACTLTLNTALSANGTCVGTVRGQASTYNVTGAVTGFTVTSALAAGAKIDYWCADH